MIDAVLSLLARKGEIGFMGETHRVIHSAMSNPAHPAGASSCSREDKGYLSSLFVLNAFLPHLAIPLDGKSTSAQKRVCRGGRG